MKAKDIMTTPVVTVAADTHIKQVVETLVRNDIGALPVVSARGELMGIVSEADLVGLQASDPRRHVLPIAASKEPPPQTAGDVMTRDVVAVFEDTDVADIARLMLDRRIRHVPVIDELNVIGIVARRDILAALARSDAAIEAELQSMLDEQQAILGSISARVEEGIAYLKGADDKQMRRLAEVVARGIPGVVRIQFE